MTSTRVAIAIALVGVGLVLAGLFAAGRVKDSLFRDQALLLYAFTSSDYGDENLLGVAAYGVGSSDPFFLTCECAQDTDPAVSDDGSEVAFASDRHGNWDIYSLRGGCLSFEERRDDEPNRLTDDPATDRAPAWSPDKKWIAFHSNRTGLFQIFVMKKNGSDLQQLTDSARGNWSPSWSPDGKSIAFHSARNGNSELYVMLRDGTNERRLTHNPAADESPAWSPDGTTLAFVSDRGDDRGTYLLDLEDLVETRISELGKAEVNLGALDSSPAWCSSTCVAFLSDRKGEQGTYYLYLGRNEEVLYGPGREVTSISFARKLAFWKEPD